MELCHIFTARIRRMGEGNVLTRVCPSVCPRGGGALGGQDSPSVPSHNTLCTPCVSNSHDALQFFFSDSHDALQHYPEFHGAIYKEQLTGELSWS